LTKLLLVRHGQTVWNHEMKYQGHADIELSALGVEQAEQVAKRLAGFDPAAIYASDLCRAVRTAEIIAQQYGLPVTALSALRELNFGEWEGKNYEGIGNQWPETMGMLFTHPDEVQIPGGENFLELETRASKAVQELVVKHAGETVLVVSHGGTIRSILCAALHIPLKYFWNIRQDNTAVNIIDFYEDRTIVALVNDTHHLDV
jgi:alpha-ribazole phosphatase